MAPVPGSAHANLTLGGLVAVGGIVGYVRKGSTMSLVAGVVFGSLLCTSAYLIATPSSSSTTIFRGHVLAATTSGIMALGMGQRYLKTNKIMPAGMVALLGAAACAYNIHKAREWHEPSGSDAKSS
jgi:uncharacterized membrane protein (UPF0136 family)